MNELEKQMYWSKIPEVLQSNENFKVFMELAAEEFRIDLANIESFTDLIDPDKVPSKFINALGGIVGYDANLNSDEFSREALQRVQSVYSSRGTTESILMASNHGNNEGWLGGNLFVPGYEIGKEESYITFTAEKLFTHCRSKFSGTDVYSDSGENRAGVVLLNVPYLDDDIRNAVLRNVPAGTRYYFKVVNNIIPNKEDGGDYGELVYKTGEVLLDISRD